MEMYFYVEGIVYRNKTCTCNIGIVSGVSCVYTVKCSLFSQTHSGSVWRVTWAHPEYGQALATCSFDRTVGIWEEQSACYSRS